MKPSLTNPILLILIFLGLMPFGKLEGQALRLQSRDTLQGVYSVSAVIQVPQSDLCILASDDGNSHASAIFRPNYDLWDFIPYPNQSKLPQKEDGRIKKSAKRDFEAAFEFGSHGSAWAYVFGSGSMMGTRTFIQSMSQIGPENWKIVVEKQCDLFYQHLAQAAKIEFDQLNIEGATLVKGKVLKLFNREGGWVFNMALKDFRENFRKGFDKGLPKVWVEQIELPKINGFEAGFSSASTDKFGFCWVGATAEATEDWVNDGEILGSAIGRFKPGSRGSVGKIEWMPLSNVDGSPLPLKGLKIEAITTAIYRDRPGFFLDAFTDSDGGFSEHLLFQYLVE